MTPAKTCKVSWISIVNNLGILFNVNRLVHMYYLDHLACLAQARLFLFVFLDYQKVIKMIATLFTRIFLKISHCKNFLRELTQNPDLFVAIESKQ